MAPLPAGNGYWLLNRNGEIYSFGAAAYQGGSGTSVPAIAITPTAGVGYWIALAAGSVIPRGDATGLSEGRRLAAPVVGIVGG
jgi:hypothetical protein